MRSLQLPKRYVNSVLQNVLTKLRAKLLIVSHANMWGWGDQTSERGVGSGTAVTARAEDTRRGSPRGNGCRAQAATGIATSYLQQLESLRKLCGLWFMVNNQCGTTPIPVFFNFKRVPSFFVRDAPRGSRARALSGTTTLYFLTNWCGTGAGLPKTTQQLLECLRNLYITSTRLAPLRKP